ncbi:MAG TPA: hypothetical protein VK645_04800 [Chitinophagaceae bacterium]|nr:hypothetical protein [Chitinophagaceae bacterium]
MKIVNETELMNNQKASATITPDVEFEAVETSAGNSVLFSISSENIFYCTCEVPGDTHGWTRADMSSILATGNFQGKTIQAKSFDVGQDLSAGTIDLALVITVDGQDYLYIANNVSDSNLAGIRGAWQQFPFDDQGAMQLAGKPINDVFVTRADGQMYVFADINTRDATNTLTRYAVDQSNTIMVNILGFQQAWIPHGMAMDAQAGAISNAIGCGPDDAASGGIYTLCNIANIPQLQYAAIFNNDDPGGPAFPVNFQLPSGTEATCRAMAVSASAQAPYTDLFFATNTTVNGVATGALYFIPAASQLVSGGKLPAFTQVFTNDLLYNIQSLHVDNWNNNIVLWGQSKYADPTTHITTSQLFVMECVRGQETNVNAWSYPIPLLFDVENSATYINSTFSSHSAIDPANGNAYGSCSVIFAHQAGGSLVKLFQDPVTSAWQQRFLLTEPLDVQTEIFDTTTYSTHIEITDDYNTTQINVPVAVWASSPCSVHINDATNTDAYFNLDTEKPLLLTTDTTGNVTIMQQVDSIGGIAYYVAVQDPATKQVYTQAINPMTNTVSRLNTQVPDSNKDYLQGVPVSASDGTQSLLVSSAHNSSTATTSNNISTICKQNANLNQDGLATGQSWPNAASVAAAFASVQAVSLSAGKPAVPPAIKPIVKRMARPDRRFRDIRFNPKTDKIWGWTFGKEAAHYEGIDAVKALGVVLNADSSLSLQLPNAELGSIFGNIEAKIGHIVKWMKTEAHNLEQAVVTFTDGVIDCVLKIAGNFYHFLAKCANDIVNLVHTVLNAIETAFDDIVKWIGFIFEYKDILNTHNVMKNLMLLYLDSSITNASSLKGKLQSMFTGLENNLNQLVGLPQIDTTQQSNSAQASKPSAANTPQANWGTHKLKSNGGNASSGNYNPPNTGDDPSGGLLAAFHDIVQGEKDTFTDLKNNLASIIDNFQTTSASELFEKILVTITDFLLNQAGTLLAAGADAMAGFASFVKETLTATIDIPVISWLYGKISGGAPFSILDLCCLIAAIPATIVYKVLEGAAPYPDSDETTQQLINAPDLATIQSIWAQPLDTINSGLLGHGGGGSATQTRYDTAVKVSNIFGMIGAVGVSITTTAKSGLFPGLKDNKYINIINSVCFLMYVLPDVTQSTQSLNSDITWYNLINTEMTYMAVLKTGVDAVGGWGWGWSELWSEASPAADFAINLLWQVPTCAGFYSSVTADHREQNWANGVLCMTGGSAFDFSGILSLALQIAQEDEDPTTGPIAIGVACAAISLFNVIWGTSCILESWGPLTPPPPLSSN